MADMPLNKLARDFAAEISYHDWSDAPFRIDRAGHRREHDGRNASAFHLDAIQTENVRTNVMWVVAQVLGHHDPNLDIYRFAEACGVDTRTPSGRPRSGFIAAGLRHDSIGRLAGPVLCHTCHVCDRAVEPDDQGKVRREGVVREGSSAVDWAWGPVVVHEECRTKLRTPLDHAVGNGYKLCWEKIAA
jgi:hypothetical protein